MGCHLDAHTIGHALDDLRIKPGALLFIENVGNLVCPATFDLGEHERIVLISVPEGSDKPAKYPKAFTSSQGFIITKTDLLPYFDFSIDEAREEAFKLNQGLKVLELSATSGDGFDDWLSYLEKLAAK